MKEGTKGVDVSKTLGLKAAASGVMRNYNAMGKEGDAKTFALKANKLKEMVGRSISINEWSKYKYDFVKYVSNFNFAAAEKSQNTVDEQDGIDDHKPFFQQSGDGSEPKINWKRLHIEWKNNKEVVPDKWHFDKLKSSLGGSSTSSIISEILGLHSFEQMYTEAMPDEPLKDGETRLNPAETFKKLKDGKKWISVNGTDLADYEEAVKAYCGFLVGAQERKLSAQSEKDKAVKTELMGKRFLGTGLVNRLLQQQWYSKIKYLPDIFLTFDKNNDPTFYYYNFNFNIEDPSDTSYKNQLAEIFAVNSADVYLKSEDSSDKIPLVYISHKKGVNETAIWPALLGKVYDKETRKEEDAGLMIDGGFDMVKSQYQALVKEKDPFKDIAAYEKYLGMNVGGVLNVIPKFNDLPQEAKKEKEVLTRRILWNLACKESQRGWMDEGSSEDGFKRDKVQEDDTVINNGDNTGAGETVQGDAIVINKGDNTGAGDNNSNVPNPAITSGGSNNEPLIKGGGDKFLESIVSKSNLKKAWQLKKWIAAKADEEKQLKKWIPVMADEENKNPEYSLINKWNREFCGYLGKSEGTGGMGGMGAEAAGDDVFIVNTAEIRIIGDSIREHFVNNIEPTEGKLTFKNKNAFLGVFGGKRKRKSHRKSHKKTQKKHKKQMKKSHKKVHKKKTRGKKC